MHRIPSIVVLCILAIFALAGCSMERGHIKPDSECPLCHPYEDPQFAVKDFVPRGRMVAPQTGPVVRSAGPQNGPPFMVEIDAFSIKPERVSSLGLESITYDFVYDGDIFVGTLYITEGTDFNAVRLDEHTFPWPRPQKDVPMTVTLTFGGQRIAQETFFSVRFLNPQGGGTLRLMQRTDIVTDAGTDPAILQRVDVPLW